MDAELLPETALLVVEVELLPETASRLVLLAEDLPEMFVLEADAILGELLLTLPELLPERLRGMLL